ncbi:hypothetical protein C8R45DRAFT_1019656, partial [Mycena sanguinolenta]
MYHDLLMRAFKAAVLLGPLLWSWGAQIVSNLLHCPALFLERCLERYPLHECCYLAGYHRSYGLRVIERIFR